VSQLAIELNDHGILAVGETGGTLSPNPGYAFLEGNAVVVGREAARRARLSPRRIHNRFWEELDTNPLRRPYPHHLSTADLAHAHLTQIWSEVGDGVDSALLAIPGRHTDHQLGLILGVARSCGIPVSGMVDSAVASVADLDLEGAVLHLDLQLHSAVLTTLDVKGGPVRRHVTVSDRVGVFPLVDTLAKHAASLFLRATRFDPLHQAASEQSLYDQLPQWVRNLRTNDLTPIAIETAGHRYEIELTRRGVIGAANGHLDHLAELVRLNKPNGSATLILSHSSSQFPGLSQRLCERNGLEAESLPIAAAAAGALRHADMIAAPGETLPLVTNLATRGADESTLPDVPERTTRKAVSKVPTHILHDGLAFPITDRPFVVGVALQDGEQGLELKGNTAGISRSHCSVLRHEDAIVVEDHSSYGSFLNERRIDGSEVVDTDDVLRLGTPGIQLRFIAVADH
jgi:hypothetical protein